jgi:peptidoglycan/xylan/chitin deacetylase (PgdA/CDA1 family)
LTIEFANNNEYYNIKKIHAVSDWPMMEKIKENQYLWNLFSCKEEYDPIITDKYGRCPHYASNNRDVFEPIVSEYLVNNGFDHDYPDGHKFALCITHDIDVVYENISLNKSLKSVKSIKSGKIREGLKSAFEIPFKKEPWWNFHEIVEIEKQYGAKSTFFCMAINKGELDWNYNIVDLAHELSKLLDDGWEVGLHGGHSAFKDPTKMCNERVALEKVLNRKIIGYRNHFLRFLVPNTWEALSKYGFKYDSTYGYADCIGFRNGMCHPFRPYNRITEKPIDIMEIPLNLMDGTLFDSYMRLDPDAAWQISKRIIDNAEKCGGVITILWHNTQMYGDSLKLYNKILDYCHQKKAWLTSGEEIHKCFSNAKQI